MKVAPELNFFVPHTRTANYESAYESVKSSVKYQMGWPVTDRRIESLTYMSNNKQLKAKVGGVGEYEHQYEVVAILESAKYIIVTKTKSGLAGPTILVDTKDIVAIQDFSPRALATLNHKEAANV